MPTFPPYTEPLLSSFCIAFKAGGTGWVDSLLSSPSQKHDICGRSALLRGGGGGETLPLFPLLVPLPSIHMLIFATRLDMGQKGPPSPRSVSLPPFAGEIFFFVKWESCLGRDLVSRSLPKVPFLALFLLPLWPFIKPVWNRVVGAAWDSPILLGRNVFIWLGSLLKIVHPATVWRISPGEFLSDCATTQQQLLQQPRRAHSDRRPSVRSPLPPPLFLSHCLAPFLPPFPPDVLSHIRKGKKRETHPPSPGKR